MQGGFPIDLILFAMVAAFLVLRLRSVLGKRQGFERQPQPQPLPDGRVARADGVVEEIAPARREARRIIPDPRGPVGQGLARIGAADPSFEPNGFLDGAEGAFRMIVGAFAAGDRATLRPLLSDDTYAGFEGAISSRENAGESQRTEIRSMHEMAIEGADLRGTTAEVTVRITSDQVNLTTGRNGEIVAGSDAITEVTDIWTFQRDVTSGDPSWRLVATRSA
ncbi:Tim44/TimA family putative adaptor protein [Sabulicella glaciei]|uniref:Tim44/TimA family putative adaptor protein n=1 Tax=Sabulicella glaciei TaxID=2984948 RepID=A0ABT3P0K7_9PROT|nr:Tim44/TimA family putative adaptor protein [Roseococcus sp. MDT2-1-1]MCW8087941.1 Tim44/TimA family putative adaptor protein [Roseococcus sp. MDT2-1-1]